MKIQVLSIDRSTQHSGDKNSVSRSASGPCHQSLPRNPPLPRDGNHGRRTHWQRARFATDNHSPELFQTGFHSFIKIREPPYFDLSRDRYRRQKFTGLPSHRGKITQDSRHCFPADSPGIFARQVMNALHHRVGFQKNPFVPHLNHRAIISRTNDHSFGRRKAFTQLRDQSIFSQFSNRFHDAGTGKYFENNMKNICIPLKAM